MHKFDFFTFTWKLYGERRFETCAFAAVPNHPSVTHWFNRILVVMQSKIGDPIRGRSLNDMCLIASVGANFYLTGNIMMT